MKKKNNDNEYDNSNYIDPEYSKLDSIADLSPLKKEKFDVYSLGKVIEGLLEPVLSKDIFPDFQKELKLTKCYSSTNNCTDPDKDCSLEKLYNFLEKDQIMSKIYGEVDAFWEKNFEQRSHVPYVEFVEKFLDFFNKNKDEANNTLIDRVKKDLQTIDNSDDSVKPFLGIKDCLRLEVKREEHKQSEKNEKKSFLLLLILNMFLVIITQASLPWLIRYFISLTRAKKITRSTI